MKAPTQPDDPLARGEGSEGALVLALRAGDPAAFEAVVRSQGARMLAVARRVLRDEEEARDVVQEAFLTLHRGIGGFHGESRLSTWLHRVVVNGALMRLRTRRRRPEEPIETLLPAFHEDGHPAEIAAEWVDPAETLDQEARRELVRSCIDRLPETYRTVLLLRDIEDLDTAETAAALGVSDNAVKIRLHRARQALRSLLDPHLREVGR